MMGYRLFYALVTFLSIGTFDGVTGLVQRRSSAEHCDRASTARVREGNLGQSADFNWLGVLNVHLHDGDKYHTALSGIVLIKIKYALAHADDVVRIPQHIFKTSRAMFLVAQNTPWYVAPVSFIIHPEYESSTSNSIAIIELDLHGDIPLTPICLFTANTLAVSSHLYLTGFTDENQLLEKVIYRIQYLDNTVCEQFYNKAGLQSQSHIPSEYLCGYAPSNVTRCVWDNGMALVSTATGYFNLIGFAVCGPGCAAPARFIDLFPYFSWIKSVTSPEEVHETAADYRRKEDLDDGYDDDIQVVPIHDLFTVTGSRREELPDGVLRHEYVPYPFDIDLLTHFTVEPTMDNDTIAIMPFDEEWENHNNACSLPRTLMYHEFFDLKTTELKGVVTYKLALFDLLHEECICVLLTVNCTKRSDAVLSFKEVITFQGEKMPNEDLTPEEIFKINPLTERTVKLTTNETIKDPAKSPFLKPAFVENKVKSKNIFNYDLYIKFEFSGTALMEFQMYAKEKNLRRDFTTTEAFTDTTELTVRRAKIRVKPTKRTQKPIWAMNKMYTEDGVTSVADKDVQETVSAGCIKEAAGHVAVTCWAMIAGLGRAFFVNLYLRTF